MIRSRMLIRVISVLVLTATTLSSCSALETPTAPEPGRDASSLQGPIVRLLKRVAYTSERLEILSYLLSRDDLLLMQVSGELEHFSRYAVAW